PEPGSGWARTRCGPSSSRPGRAARAGTDRPRWTGATPRARTRRCGARSFPRTTGPASGADWSAWSAPAAVLRSSVRIEHYLHRAAALEQRHRVVEIVESLEFVGDEILHVQARVQEVEHLDPRVEDAATDHGVEGEPLEDQAVRVVL